ncbi:MAG: metal-dependent transcriptional regulator [Oscillospiraceae bacterium]|nr:metal-dependent transcriptional regulator [Oscillospiraceae bacterium]
MYESGEDYLETILLLHEKTGFVRSVDIACELNYSKPSISRAMNILKESGYITVQAGGQILLTEEGRKKAESIYERHVNITRFLEKVLSVSQENAEHDACKIEHIISEESYEKLKRFTAEYISGKEK